MRGAEILLHPTSEIYQRNITPKDAAKISRSVENMIYVISTNTAGIVNSYIPSDSVDGGSKIIDYRGIVVAETGAGESMAAFADINLAGLRGDHQRPGLNNLLSRQRFEIYAQSYLNSQFYPPNTMADGNIERKHFIQTQKQTIERLTTLGII